MTKNTEIISVEKGLVGSLLIKPQKYLDVCTIVQPHMVSNPSLKDILTACYGLLDTAKKFDLTVLIHELGKAKGSKVSMKELKELFNYANTDMIEEYAQRVKLNYLAAETFKISDLIMTKSIEGEDPFSIISDIENETERLLNDFAPQTDSHISGLCAEVEDNLLGERTGVVGIDTRWPDLNRALSGLRKGKFMVIAARPGMGKTYLTAAILLNSARSLQGTGESIAIYLLEQTRQEFTTILISIITGFSVEQLDSRSYLNEISAAESQENKLKVHNAFQDLYDLPIYIEDKIYNLDAIHMDLRAKKRKNNVRIMAIDYLQLVNVKRNRSDNMETMTARLSRRLKNISMPGDCDLTVLALSQLSREVENRGGGKRPQLSDLRYSGAIEQDADVVIFPYRAEYYDIFEDADGESTKGIAELIIAKNRGGEKGSVMKHFDRGIFSDLKEKKVDLPKGNWTKLETEKESGDLPF